MKITEKLLGYLHRVFKKDPQQFVAIQIAYAGTGMTWSIADQTFSTVVVGGTGTNLTADLTQYTVAGLADYIGSQTGYSVVYVDTSALADLSALVLIEAAGDVNVTGGDRLNGFTSLLWAWVDAVRSEIKPAAAQIANLYAEMSTTTADTIWLDFIGDLYGIRRGIVPVDGVPTREADAQYAPRIPSEVLALRGNNIAISEAIRAASGQPALVVDAPVFTNTGPFYGGTFNFDGSHIYNGTSATHYGLFDVQYAYDLEGSTDLTDFQAIVVATIEKFRDAGTFLRSLSLQASSLFDEADDPSDRAPLLVVSPALVDSATSSDAAPAVVAVMDGLADSAGSSDAGIGMTVTSTLTYSGLRSFDGSRFYGSGLAIAESD